MGIKQFEIFGREKKQQMEIKRFRVFGKGEKQHLAKELINLYFPTFKYVKNPVDNPFNLYFLDEKNGRILLDYGWDIFKYSGKFSQKDILLFKEAYQNEMACKLAVLEDSLPKNKTLISRLNSP